MSGLSNVVIYEKTNKKSVARRESLICACCTGDELDSEAGPSRTFYPLSLDRISQHHNGKYSGSSSRYSISNFLHQIRFLKDLYLVRRNLQGVSDIHMTKN
jgi:hypothetical protein